MYNVQCTCKLAGPPEAGVVQLLLHVEYCSSACSPYSVHADTPDNHRLEVIIVVISQNS